MLRLLCVFKNKHYKNTNIFYYIMRINVKGYFPFHIQKSIKEYINCLSESRTAYTEEHPNRFERYDEEVMLRLRTSDGLDLGIIASHYGDQAANGLLLKAQPFINQGLLKLNNNTLTLTPQGIMTSDNIIRTLMWDSDNSL